MRRILHARGRPVAPHPGVDARPPMRHRVRGTPSHMRTIDYSGTIAYVVGGSMGIGLAAAKALAARGADVLVLARRAAPLAQACREILERRARPSQRVESRVLDVCDADAVAAVMAEAVARFGPPDLLVNCAGRARPDYFERIPSRQLEDTLRVNVGGLWNTTQALLPHLRARRGCIVNTASVAGIIGILGYTDYAASKFAVIGFSEALRSELAGSGVRVSVLCPPDTDTPGLAEEDRTKPAETAALAAAARRLTAEEVAAELLAGLDRGRFLIVPGRAARLLVLAKRLFPDLVARAIDRTVMAARRR